MHLRRRFRGAHAASILILALTSVGCGADNGGAEQAGTPTPAAPSPSDTGASQAPTSPSPRPAGTTITSAPSDYGQVLWGPDRQVVYIWEKEPSGAAECYDDCAEAWPPVLTTGEPVAARGVDATLLGTITRRDGATQVTYNGHPLYYYAHEGPGEVRCHNVATHGGLWWVVTPAGDRAA
jgi:predicted lipoprotein with Yx(FWY)xxD motif